MNVSKQRIPVGVDPLRVDTRITVQVVVKVRQVSGGDQLDPSWGSSIVVYSAKNYDSITEFWALKSVAHELAHAYQLEQWPEKQTQIMRAFEDAMSRGLYHGVQDDKGQTLAIAYAATNQLEYFAELTCMYYVGCNYHPKNRATLKRYDPTGFRMVEQMGSPYKAPLPVKSPRRIWKDSENRFAVVARLVRHESGVVTLKKDDGAIIGVPMDRLSEADQRYCRQR